VTELGATGHGPVVRVEPSGVFAPLGTRAAVDWWVGAEDRWHHAGTEAAVRQTVADDQVTIETRLRVPGGDVVHRVTVVPDGSSSTPLIEIANETPVPVAIAIVVPTNGDISVFDDTLRCDGVLVARASRSVARVLAGADIDALGIDVEAGLAQPPSEMEQPLHGSHVALVFPLPHTATLRCSLPTAVPDGSPTVNGSSPKDLPPFDAVARGWDVHLNAGAELVLPDERLSRAIAAARRHLLVGSSKSVGERFWIDGVEPWVPAAASVALDLWGHHIEARELLLDMVGTDDLVCHATRPIPEAGALLWAWAERLERRPDPELEAALRPWIQDAAAGLVARRRGLFSRKTSSAVEAWRAVGLAAAGSLLTRWGDTELGPDIVDAMPELLAEAASASDAIAFALGANRLAMQGRPDLLAHLASLVGARAPGLAGAAALSTATGALEVGERSQHPLASALLLLAARRAVVDEPDGTGGVVAVLSAPDTGWLGAGIEGHRVPVTGGTMSFGARWHGDRPALLWDLTTSVAAPEVSAPGLDPDWRVGEAKGETLLAATPGLAVDAGPESPEVRRGQTINPDDEPTSFA
jgi:hypothetical protein